MDILKGIKEAEEKAKEILDEYRLRGEEILRDAENDIKKYSEKKRDELKLRLEEFEKIESNKFYDQKISYIEYIQKEQEKAIATADANKNKVRVALSSLIEKL